MSDTRQKYGGGRKLGIYAEPPVKRSCECPEPAVYLDEDGDPACFRCGHLVKVAKAA